MKITPADQMASAAGWKTIAEHLPEDLEELAREHKVLETQYGEAKITAAEDLLRLILLHAGADLALRQTVALIAEGGGPEVSHVTLHKKMRLAWPFLRALLGRLTAMSADALPERWAGYELSLVDGSSFCGPGADGADARIHLQLRLSDLAILSVSVEDRSLGESFKRFPWHAGQLALGDRGYANPPGIAWVVEQGAEVLVRVNRSALPMYSPDGNRVDLMAWLRSLKGFMPRERPVLVRARDSRTEVQGRLIAYRLPEAQAEKARAWVRREHGTKTSATDLEAAGYVILFTTVPVDRMSTAMCLELYRLRWQVELAFKRWKSLCHFDRLPNHRDDTILTWLYAKLLIAVLLQRMALGVSELFPPEDEADEDDDEDDEDDDDFVAFDALEGCQPAVARPRRRTAAA
jgi:hypothetical protein